MLVCKNLYGSFQTKSLGGAFSEYCEVKIRELYREGELLGEGCGLQRGVLVREARGDVGVLHQAADLDRVVVIRVEYVAELGHPSRLNV